MDEELKETTDLSDAVDESVETAESAVKLNDALKPASDFESDSAKEDVSEDVTDTPVLSDTTIKPLNPVAITCIVVLIAAIIGAILFILIKNPFGSKNAESVSTTNETEASVSDSASGDVSGDEPAPDPDAEYGMPDSADFSFGLTEDGFIKDADLSTVADLDMEALEIPYLSVAYIDDKVDADLLEVASQYAGYMSDPELTVQNGNTIDLDYSGSIDGVKFDGGTAEHQSLTIGSGSFIDNFEEQLIGAHPGDTVMVTVTFPDPYNSSPDLAGKEAVFECKVNSIWRTPEVDDEFVRTYLGDYADNLADMKAYIKEQGYKSNISSYIATYINDNASAADIPSAYLDNLKLMLKYSEKQNFEQYKTYMIYYGYYDAASMSYADYSQISVEEFNQIVDEAAVAQATVDLTYEALFKKYNLTVNDDIYNQILEYYGASAEEFYGKPFILQTAIKYSVTEYLKDKVTVTGKDSE